MPFASLELAWSRALASSLTLALALALALLAPRAWAQDALERGFRDPPAAARPHTWWHWMNGNVTREGITRDLEAMARIGLGGAQIFNVSESIPEGPVAYMSEAWRALATHAAREAGRVGLELCFHNCAGWSSSGGPWNTPEHAMQMVVVGETRAAGPAHFAAALPQPETRCGYYRDIAVLAFPTPRDDRTRIDQIAAKAGFEPQYGLEPRLDELPAEAAIARGAIVDLSAALDRDGRLTWDVPAGEWTILRFGHTPTGQENHPAPASGRGLECDKLSREALDAHWAGAVQPWLRDLGPLAGQVLRNCLIDSYEVGQQNWTPRFRDEFRARRGYDPLLLLPVLTGRVVDSGPASERFLWDFRRTIADLFADAYYGHFAELCHANGLAASIEPYDGPFECLLAGRDADVPMGEFWVGGGESGSCKLAASVAHTYGRKIAGAEAFTADPNTGRWLNHPFALKAVGDLMYATGINRYIVHRYAHQPWLDRVPGMTMGQWGTHFERTNTWWEQGAAWVRYLARCQFLLQQGAFAADVCLFAGEGAPSGAPHDPGLKARGFDYDACNADVLLRHMSVVDGRLVLPDGMSYRVLVLPDSRFMTPALLAKVGDLVHQGATVIARSPTHSPSLADLGDGDALVRRNAGVLWADCDGERVKEHAFGRGRVVWARSIDDVLESMDVAPDCTFRAARADGVEGERGEPKMAWIHRVADGADLYFVSNQRNAAAAVECSFRVVGRLPELWHPDTGAIEVAPTWSEAKGRTTVTIRFDPAGSVFVVFRRPAVGASPLVSVVAPAGEPAPLPRIEVRAARYEAIDGAGGADVTEKVRALVAAGETSIPASNATFGDPALLHEKRLRVDYAVDGRPPTARTVQENGTLELVAARAEAPAAYDLAWTTSGQLEVRAFRSGAYELHTADGGAIGKIIDSVPPPLAIEGPWSVRFPPARGAPERITLAKLASWTEHEDAGVRYFSGTAEYETTFEIAADALRSDRVLVLDLGRVQCIAEVRLNDQDLGIWWKPPFAAEVTALARAGENTLRVRVTNLWVNRLIGDEQHPDDCEWNGVALARWPQWLLDGTPRPSSERVTFTTWKHWRKDAPLLESGLLGPVELRTGVRVRVE